MMVPVGLDVGYGFTKVATSKKVIRFSSTVGRAERLAYQPENFGLDQPGNAVILNKRSYFVGELAEKQSAIKYKFCDREWVNSDLYRVLILAAFSQAKLLKKPCALVTGLPVDYFGDRQKVIDLLKGESLFEIQLDQIRVIPQPFGTLFDLLLSPDGGIQEELLGAQSVGLIDIGHYTTDCIFVDALSYVEHASGTSAGMSLAFETIAREMKSKMALSFAPEHFVERLAFQWADQSPYRPPKELVRLIKSAYTDLADQISGYVRTLWSRKGFPDRVILTGGGAYLLGGLLKERMPKIVVAKDPDLANVRGYLKYGQRLFGEKV